MTAKKSNQVDELLKKADELRSRGDFKNATTHCNMAAGIDPFNSKVYQALGVIRSAVGDVGDAQDCLVAAICLDGDNPAKDYWELGNFFYYQNKLLLSIMCYLRAIQINPAYRMAHNNLSGVLDAIDNRKIWAATFKKMINNNPNALDAGPLRIRIETSSRCNLRCQHCPTGTNYKGTDRQIMEMETFDKLIAQMQEFQIISNAILYLGGEPLLNKNLALMCKRVKEETLVGKTLFTTNGMLVNEKICEALSMADVDQINVSIDGRSPEENDRVRKGSNYAEVLRNTRLLKSYLPNAKICIVNVQIKCDGDPETPIVPDFLARDFIGFPISSTYAMVWPGFDVKNSSIEGITSEGITSEGITSARRSSHNFCIHPFTNMAVRPNGDVIVCCYDILGEHVMGNIHEKSLIEIWQSRSYREMRDAMLSRDVGRLPGICRKCIHFTGQNLVVQN